MPTLEHSETHPQPWLSLKGHAEPRWTHVDCDDEKRGEVDAWNDKHSTLLASQSHQWVDDGFKALRQAEVELQYEDFSQHVSIWKRDTGHLSSLSKMLAHPSYLRIIALGAKSEDILRSLLRELQSEPDHWFAALNAITGEDPVSAESDLDESVEAWIQWGRERGIL